jgi:3-methyladenine DNA glycosylase AlkD
MIDIEPILTQLKALGSPEQRASKSRLGIPAERSFGTPLTAIRQLGKRLGRDQALALALWESGYHEARLLAVLLAEPAQMETALIERWLADVVSWDLCDHLCSNLFYKLPTALARISTWAADEREFVRRAAFALITAKAIHSPVSFQPHAEEYLASIGRYAHDPRNFVKKAVSWALREIGKRFPEWHDHALELARTLADSENKAERWVGKDALSELENLVVVPGRKWMVSAQTKSGRQASKL